MAAEREGFSEDRINRMDLHRERLEDIDGSERDWHTTEGELRNFRDGNSPPIYLGDPPTSSSLTEFATIATIGASLTTIYLFVR